MSQKYILVLNPITKRHDKVLKSREILFQKESIDPCNISFQAAKKNWKGLSKTYDNLPFIYWSPNYVIFTNAWGKWQGRSVLPWWAIFYLRFIK